MKDRGAGLEGRISLDGPKELEPIEDRLAAVERALEAAQAQIRLMSVALDHVGRGLMMIDASGHVVVSNAMAAELVGVPSEVFARKPHISEVIALQWEADEFRYTPEPLKSKFRTLISKPFIDRYSRPRPDGRIVEVESIPLADGGQVRTHTDITERHAAEQRIAYMARHDALTGLGNRNSFQTGLEQALLSGAGVAVLLIDVDRFKEINDAYGHAAGDALLVELAERLRANLRPTDFAARLGGDEFAIVMQPLAGVADAEDAAARLIEAAIQPIEVGGRHFRVEISVGIMAVLERTDSCLASRSALLRQADIALYAAKSSGRCCWRVFDPALQERHLVEQTMLTELQAAFACRQFEVFYQPVVATQSGRVCAFEALVRWHHPVRGLLAAAEFIPLAETCGLIVPLGAWVLVQACRDATNWPDDVRLLVNLSPRQLASPDLLGVIREALSAGLPPSRLELEITATCLLQMTQAVGTFVGDVRRLGVRVALDDFGGGCPSLPSMRLFAFDTIKIDRSFMADAGSGPAGLRGSRAIVRAVTSLAGELGLSTIAEGVESVEQVVFLRSVGCQEMEGHLFSTAGPARDVAAMLTNVAKAFAALP